MLYTLSIHQYITLENVIKWERAFCNVFTMHVIICSPEIINEEESNNTF